MKLTALFELSPKQLARWEKLRARGKWRFVLIWGAGVWGGSAFLSTVAIDFLFSFQGIDTGGVRPADILLDFVFFGPVMGVACGLVAWSLSEMQYVNHLQNRENSLKLPGKMTFKKVMGILACLPIIGFSATIILLALGIKGFSELLNQSHSPTSEELHAAVLSMTHRLFLAFVPVFVGLVCFVIGVVAIRIKQKNVSGSRI